MGGSEVGKSAGLDEGGVDPILIEDVASGDDFFPGQKVVLGEEGNVLLGSEGLEGANGLSLVLKTTSSCFVNPFLRIAVAVEDDSGVLDESVANHLLDGVGEQLAVAKGGLRLFLSGNEGGDIIVDGG